MKLFSALLLAIGIAASGFFIKSGIQSFRNFDRAVEVKGLAEQTVKSNLASWNIYFNVTGNNLKDLYKEVNLNQQQITVFLNSNGFESKDIQLGSINVTDNFANVYDSNRDNSKVPHYQLSGSVTLTTSKVDQVAKSSQAAGELINQGIIVTSNSINYIYTDLNSIKAKMLNEATQNARLSAQAFATNTQSKVGKIKTATQGVFTIASTDGTMINDTQSIDKKVRVVTSIQFFLD